MLQIVIPPLASEVWNEEREEFEYNVVDKEYPLTLEHSLLSISKWESKWHKSFFLKKDKTAEETLHYIKCMTLNKNFPEELYARLTPENIKEIDKYINDPMTATTFSNHLNKSPSRQIITSELVYYWMVSFNIPFECEKWHIARLLTLIRVCEAKNTPPKKMSQKERIAHYAAINAANRKKYNTKG